MLLGGQAFGHGPPQLLDRELRVTSALEAVVVHGDEPRLRQVIDNLLGNTLKYVPAGGSVSLRVSAHADLAVLEVSDDGPGFDRAAEELFARFVRGRAVTAAGSGIGLAVVAELVRAHGGTYEAGSSPLGGALVRLHLPA
ncbi:MAG: ATP-binding protein [Actinobacteria bacterium]|nr:ATP-binding protein [Actinomycetota bacterium]MBW3646719.1 ATP-binding protein [Actinomycetota bacterium]